MSDNLVTVATFNTPAEAHMAKNQLEAEGITAFVGDEEAMGMLGPMNFMGGAKLLVPEEQSLQAGLVLTRHLGGIDDEVEVPSSEPGSSREVDERFTRTPPVKGIPLSDTSESISETPLGGEPEEHELDEEPIVESPGDDLSRRALYAAIFGIFLFCLPLHIYSIVLLTRFQSLEGEMEPAWKRRALIAWIIDIPLLILYTSLVLRIIILDMQR